MQKYKTVIIYRYINNHTGDLRFGPSLWVLLKVRFPLSTVSLLQRFSFSNNTIHRVLPISGTCGTQFRPVSFIRAAGLSQRAVVRHGSEEGVPQLTVDEEHDEKDQEKKHQAHHHVRGQVRLVQFALAQRTPSAGGLQQGGYADGPLRHVEGGRRVCVCHQVKVSCGSRRV